MPSQVMVEGTQPAEIVLNNRSMMGILLFAPVLVEVPEAQTSGFAVRSKRAIDLDWLKVSSSTTVLADVWVKVRYRGRWFSISSDDLTSRSALGLLDALFESAVGNAPGAKPLLALPVK